MVLGGLFRKECGSADMPGEKAAKLFERMNSKTVHFFEDDPVDVSSTSGRIVTDADLGSLKFPKGWYISKGYFRNKHLTSTGLYEEIPVMRLDGSPVEGNGGNLPS